jgi:hypothetical protein
LSSFDWQSIGSKQEKNFDELSYVIKQYVYLLIILFRNERILRIVNCVERISTIGKGLCRDHSGRVACASGHIQIEPLNRELVINEMGARF